MNVLSKLFPAARMEIMKVLFSPKDAELHVREIQRRTNLTLGNVQKELKNLLEAELVVSRRDGNRLYFTANKEHPLFAELRGMIIKSDSLPDVIRETLRKVKGIKVAFVFGSIAKKVERASSDIDLMVIGTVGLRSIISALSGLSEKFQREINPYTISPEDFTLRLHKKDVFISNVMIETQIFVKVTQHELEAMAR